MPPAKPSVCPIYKDKKLLLLSLISFFVSGAYTILKEFKYLVFMATVGKEYIPFVKIGALLVLVPALFIYSRFVDTKSKYQLLFGYTSVYFVFGCIFLFFLGSPTIGIANTSLSVSRYFGWLFYFFVEGYNPFVLSLFWAFTNSISTPNEAKNNYGIFIALANLGGAVSSGLACLLFSLNNKLFKITDIFMHQIVLAIAIVFLGLILFCVITLLKTISKRRLIGYEDLCSTKDEDCEQIGMFAGLKLLLQSKYVLAIAATVFFYEIIDTIFGYLRVIVAQESSSSISGMSNFLFTSVFILHSFGFLIAILGANFVIKRFGVSRCLLITPVLTMLLLLIFFFNSSSIMVIVTFIIFRSLNYIFTIPVRQALYIPTSKTIRFKSKSWIGVFGSKFGKVGGSTYTIFVELFKSAAHVPLYVGCCLTVACSWLFVSRFLGLRFDTVVKKKELICR